MGETSELCLSIDLGTGGPKIGLVTFDGDVLAHEVHHVVTHYSDDGGATQDAGTWWTIISQATKRLLATSETPAGRVRAVAVTGQYASTVPVDVNGRPTGPCLTWLDTRGGRYSRQAVGGSFQGYHARKVLQFVRKTGGAPSTSGADPVGHVLALTHDQPDVVAATRWFMEPVDYLTMRFSGVASATHASRLATWMTDNRRLTTYDYDPALLAMVGLDAAFLPPLLPFGSIVGTVTTSVAEDLGIARDAVVIAGMPDLHAAAIGSGCTNLYDTHLALSTTSWISCPVAKKKTDIKHSIASVPGLTNDSYLVINSQDTGAKALEWLRGVIAGSGHAMRYEEMTRLAASAPPGAHGVLFTPWLTGERSPVDNKRLRAGFTNLAVTTTTADLVRGVMEGVAANSAWLFKYVEKFVGQSLSPIRLLGGGAQSTLWCQIYADTLDRDVEQLDQPLLVQMRGAALLAAVALQRRRLHDAVERPTSVTFHPSSDASDLYRARAAQLPRLYARDERWLRNNPAVGP
ncbi:MAG TPA: FGGY-family carbohydrate kinase [Acidimicrobiales bacterium]|nr:FGGY-family carbohydrate kinase [Acidimicrobiales bacterium]